jgi:NAD(P)H-dependent FMN reductase
MKIGIIVGSHRKHSQSAKVAAYVKNSLGRVTASAQVYTLDLAIQPLPFWDEGVWKGDSSWVNLWTPIGNELKQCSALVVISPEYHGMVPAALKNFFLLATKDEIGHKPGLIVSVSSGRGGSYPVVELRSSSYKNSRLNWIPEHMIVRNAEHVLNADAATTEEDRMTRERLDYCLRILVEYGRALTLVRESGVIDYKTHPNGM